MPGNAVQDGTRGELIADRYQLLSRLGRGGMGEVWAGRDLRLHRDVAVKLFHGEGAASGGLPDWLRREGIAAAQINHPNVAVLYDQGAHKDRIYLVMELVAGATLDDIMRSGSLPLADSLRFAWQVGDALAAAHAAQVVHRDIKPQNVLVTPDGAVKVVDFGIAGFLNDTRSWTVARFDEAVKGSGTPEYAAPEQVIGHDADARSDLYSLGTLLYAMLCGHVPFRAESFLAVMHRKVTEDAPSLDAARPGLPPALVGLVHSLLAREPDERPRSAREVADRLRAVGADLAAPVGSKSVPEVEPQPEAAAEAAPQSGVGVQEQAGHESVREPHPSPVPRPDPDRQPPIKPQPQVESEGIGQGGEKKRGVENGTAAAVPSTPRPRTEAAPQPVSNSERKVEQAQPKPHPKVEAPPLDKTGATKLSPVAQVELHGRSLLPAQPRSLLREPTFNRFAAPPPAKSAAKQTRGSIWLVLALVFLAAAATAVYLALHVK